MMIFLGLCIAVTQQPWVSLTSTSRMSFFSLSSHPKTPLSTNSRIFLTRCTILVHNSHHCPCICSLSHILQSQLHLYTTLLRDVLWYLTLNDVIQLASLLLLLPCDHLYKQTLTLVPKGIRRNQVYLKSVS